MPPAQQRAEDLINTAIAISDAVADGANPADPAVIALLQSIQTNFGVDVVAGNDKDEFFFPNGSLFSDEDLTYTNGLGGNDILIGGKGADIFLFDPSNPDLGIDIIKDFELGADVISLAFPTSSPLKKALLTWMATRLSPPTTWTPVVHGTLSPLTTGTCWWSIQGHN